MAVGVDQILNPGLSPGVGRMRHRQFPAVGNPDLLARFSGLPVGTKLFRWIGVASLVNDELDGKPARDAKNQQHSH